MNFRNWFEVEEKLGEKHTELIFGDNCTICLKWFRATLKVLSGDSEFVLGAFEKTGYSRVSRFGIHVIHSGHPSTTMSQVTLLNYVATKRKQLIHLEYPVFITNLTTLDCCCNEVGPYVSSLPPLSLGGFHERVTDWLVISSYSRGPSGGPGLSSTITLKLPSSMPLSFFRRR